MADQRSLLAVCIVCDLAHPACPSERWLRSYPFHADRPLRGLSFLLSKDFLTEELVKVRHSILERSEHALLAEAHLADYVRVVLQPNIHLASMITDNAAKQLSASVVASEKGTWQIGQCHWNGPIATAGTLRGGSNANG
jgi:hypothetical protein